MLLVGRCCRSLQLGAAPACACWLGRVPLTGVSGHRAELGQQDAELQGLCSADTFDVAVTQSPGWAAPSWAPSSTASHKTKTP